VTALIGRNLCNSQRYSRPTPTKEDYEGEIAQRVSAAAASRSIEDDSPFAIDCLIALLN
jgi:hypothetical protein